MSSAIFTAQTYSAPTVLLELFGAFLKRNKDVRLETMLVFLSAAQHQGLGIKDLVYVCGLSESTVSRTVDKLCRSDVGPLLQVEVPQTDARRRLVYLSPDGEALLRELNMLLKNHP